MQKLPQYLEALIFASDTVLTTAEIRQIATECFKVELTEEIILEALYEIKERYNQESHAIELVEIAQGWQFMTKGAYHTIIATWLKQNSRKRLSQAALETLAIIAYRQPVSKAEMEQIRGVSCDYSLQKLLEKELVSISGRSDAPGRPLLYGTSVKFMDYFGLKSLDELPKPKDFKEPGSEIGEPSPAEELLKSDS